MLRSVSTKMGIKPNTRAILIGAPADRYNYGLVESKTIRINETWSAIKFTHPRKGKVYNNKYGTLKE